MSTQLLSQSFSEADVARSICEDSFYEFAKEIWDVVVQEDPVWNWHIEYLCDILQRMANRVFDNKPRRYHLAVNVPPGSTKSTLFSVMFPAWVWTRMPKAKIICGSFDSDLAVNFGRLTRDIVMSEKYQEYWPHIQMRDDTRGKSYFINTAGGWRKSVGTGKNITGMHAHFIIVDDPINPQSARSEAEIKTANEWLNETLPSRMVNKKVTPIMLIMQRLHQNDPTGNWLERQKKNKKGKLKHVCMPAEIGEEAIINPSYLRDFYVDGLFDPERLSRQTLDEQNALLGNWGYSGQYLQNPIPLGGGMFKTQRFVYDQPPPPSAFTQVCRFWDKAATPGGGDFTVGFLVGKQVINKKPKFWFLDVVRGQWSSDEREEIILQTCTLDRNLYGHKNYFVGVEQEPGSGGKDSAEDTTKKLAGFRTRIERPTGDKALRADPLSVQVNIGNVYVKENANWIPDMVDEFRYFPYSTHDDQVDAAAGAFNVLTRTFTIGTVK